MVTQKKTENNEHLNENKTVIIITRRFYIFLQMCARHVQIDQKSILIILLYKPIFLYSVHALSYRQRGQKFKQNKNTLTQKNVFNLVSQWGKCNMMRNNSLGNVLHRMSQHC